MEVYALENDRLPGTLGYLEQEHLKRAWAQYLETEYSWKTKLAYFIVNFGKHGLAYAQGEWLENYVGDGDYFICPADGTPPPGGHSYGINANLLGISYAAYKALPGTTRVVGDSDGAVFPPLDLRHRHYNVLVVPTNYAIQITKDMEIINPGSKSTKKVKSIKSTKKGGSSKSTKKGGSSKSTK